MASSSAAAIATSDDGEEYLSHRQGEIASKNKINPECFSKKAESTTAHPMVAEVTDDFLSDFLFSFTGDDV